MCTGVAATVRGAVSGLLLAADDRTTGQKVVDWWGENFEIHGFLRSNIYFRTPNFDKRVQMSSWRTDLNLETELRLYRGDDLRVGLYGVFRPVYDSVYEIQSELWGSEIANAAFGTAPAYPDDPFPGAQFPPTLGGFAGQFRTFAGTSGSGKSLPCDLNPTLVSLDGSGRCRGPRLDGEFTGVNSDTGTLFTGELVAAVSIDDVVFFGRVTAPIRPTGSGQERIGGDASAATYFRGLTEGFFAGSAPLAASIAASGTDPAGVLFTPGGIDTRTPVNFYAGALGDTSSFEYGSVDINRDEQRLKFDCFDNAHPWCFVREIYFDIEYKDLFLRIGKQQIVWGKTDAFRLQDKINPLDFGYHNFFPDLEERRIPQLALDAIYSFGSYGPIQDVSLEVAWVFDHFMADQFGQCGEPYAFTASCEARADAGGHQLSNFSLAAVNEVEWKLKNTEPGARLEFRLDEPSISFSFSFFYHHQDLPVARFKNLYSTDNPNSAVLLFLQGLEPSLATATTIDALSAGSNGVPGVPFDGGSSGVWLSGFDPYARDASGAPVGTLQAANQDLQNAWFMLTNVVDPAGGGCFGLSGGDLAACGAAIAAFALPWAAGEVEIQYPRLWSLGMSLDYQIPGIDTVLRLEMAADLDRHIQNTALPSQVDDSHVFQAAIGLDRSTFIPVINPNRTAFISVQTFFEHIIDYDGGGNGMVPDETTIISTFFMQNYWRNDSIQLTNLFAIDWFSHAIAYGPWIRYVFNQNWSFDFGVNLLWGKKRKHNLRDMCGDRTLSCIGDPSSWQAGQWQTLNAGLELSAEAPFWGKESFADKFMRNRDEFWIGVTYQF
jgi:hypothetical protein